MINTIQLNSNGLLSYVAYGTIGWLKCSDNKIYMCRCTQCEWVKVNDGLLSTCKVKWQVAGMSKEFTTMRTSRLLSGKINGIIYKTIQAAQNGTSNVCTSELQNGEMECNSHVDIIDYLRVKYPNINIACMGKNFNILTYRVYADNTISEKETPFNVEVTHHGLKVSVPSLDDETTFITKELALSNLNPLDVVTFPSIDETKFNLINDVREAFDLLWEHRYEYTDNDFNRLKESIINNLNGIRSSVYW